MRHAEETVPSAVDLAWFVPLWNSPNTVAGGQEWTWVYHEISKGVLNPILATQIPRHRTAGWAFSSYWDTPVETGTNEYGEIEYTYVHKSAVDAAAIPTNDLITSSFFKPFDTDVNATIPNWTYVDNWIYRADGDIEIYNRLPYIQFQDIGMAKLKNQAKLLAEMIPPLSSPAGGMAITKLVNLGGGHSIDMNSDTFKNALLWPTQRPNKTNEQETQKRWLHGDYKDAPYRLTHDLYQRIKGISNGKE